MLVAGIVAEFNPYHNGHEALCRAVRQNGATHIIAVMSGNFVQRADFAIAEKRLRAACALSTGVDLVLELPVAWATATAQVFAAGAVSLLAACGCVGTLCFGSESGDARALRTLAQALDSPPVRAGLREHLARGMTFAKARELAVEKALGRELSSLLRLPNDLLGVEYLRHAESAGWDMQPFAYRRRGVSHDAGEGAGRFASASFLRSRATEPDILRQYMPQPAAEMLFHAARRGEYPANIYPGDNGDGDGAIMRRMDTAVLAHLRRLERDDLSQLPDLSEGLENRLYAAIRESRTMDGLLWALKTKRYPMSRVRRLVLSAFLGLEKRNTLYPPPYLRVLGMNRRGRRLLPIIGKGATLPLGTSLKRLQGLGGDCAETAVLESRATDLYALALPAPLPCGFDYTAGIATERFAEIRDS